VHRLRRREQPIDATVASYRETVLTGFQEVEDNLAVLRILEEEAKVQDEAVEAARKSLAVALNQYKAGTVNYLTVIVVQAATLNNEITSLTSSSAVWPPLYSLSKRWGRLEHIHPKLKQ